MLVEAPESVTSATICPAKPTFVTLTGFGPAGTNGVCPANQICYSSGGTDQCFTCVDASINCANWNTNGMCTSDYYTAEYKRGYCPKTCGYCTGGVRACRDARSSPLDYTAMVAYRWTAITNLWEQIAPYALEACDGVSILMDLATIWKIKQMKRQSNSKNNAEFKLLLMRRDTTSTSNAEKKLILMLMTNHVIDIIFAIVSNCYYTFIAHPYVVWDFIFSEAEPYFVHCLKSIVIIAFNFDPRRQGSPKTIAVIMVKK
ncbi:unnamed protein product, partial [Mesorhabditis spiculigera]